MTHTRDFPLEIKSFDDGAGVFEGYASVFGVLDSYGEKVAPGAFVDSLARHRRDGTAPIMLWHHNPGDVIGVWTDIAEDGKGLRVVGRLLKGVRRADEALILLREKAVRGLSIGYREEAVDESDKSARILKKVALFEVSIVSIPANPRARIDGVKSDPLAALAARLRGGDAPGIGEFEGVLRDAGFPKSMAVRIASRGYANAIRSESDGARAEQDGAAFIAALARGLRA